MSYDGSLVRGSASFTGAAAKFGSGGRAGGVYDIGTPMLEFTGAVSGGALGTGTIECWFKGTNPSAIRLFWGTASSHYFGHDSSGNLLVAYGAADTWLTTSAAICDNAWHHVAVVFDATGGTISAYCDGARVGTVSATPTGANANPLGIGGFSGTAGFDSLGAIDELRISKTARYSGTTYTTPSAAFTTDSNTIALYHLESDVTNNVAGGTAPSNTVAPAVTGTTTTGQTLTCTTGTWTGDPTITYAYQWKRNGSNISGATSSTYVLQVADEGTSVKCTVTATNGVGSASADSNTVSPTSGGPSAPGNTVAPAVTGNAWTGQTLSCTTGTWTGSPTSYAYQWKRAGSAISGATSSTYVLQAADEAVAIKCTVTATNAGGSTAADSNSVTPTSLVIPANDANIVYSPYTWHKNSTRALTIDAGAYFRTLIQGSATALKLRFDISTLVAPFPQILYRVDDGPWTKATVAATVTMSIPATNAWTKHLVEVVVKSTTESQNRWSAAATAVKLTGIEVAPSTCTTVAIEQRTLNVLCFGDSITEGVRALNNSSTDDTDKNDATQGYAYRLGELLGAEVGVVGFGGLGFNATGSGSVPVLSSSWNLLYTGQARDVATTPPDLIVINLATNDSSSVTAAATTALNAMLAATPSATQIAVMRPFNGNRASELQAAIAACTTPDRVTYIDTTGWFDSADASDSLHPYGYTHVATLGPLLAEAVRTQGLIGGGAGSGSTYLKLSGGSLKLIALAGA